MNVKTSVTHNEFLNYRDRFRLIPRLMILPVVAIGAIACWFLLYENVAASSPLVALAVVALLIILLVVLYRHVAYQIVLSRFRQDIMQAQMGALKPVAASQLAGGFLGRVIADYNLLITNLGSAWTDMEECQKHVIRERNRNDAILHSLPGALLCVDEDLRVNLCNRRAEKLFGLNRDALLNSNLFDLLQLEDAGRGMLRDAFLYEMPISNKEIVLRFRENQVHFTLNLSFFGSTNSKESAAVMVLQDITDYKRLQEITYTTEKLAAMGQLAAGVAHELNTPLGSIIGYARLMNDMPSDADQVREYAHIISHEAKRCARIVEDLLNYARRDRCMPESCDINEVIKDVVETIINCQGERFNVPIKLQLDPQNPIVRGSAGQLDIVLVNVLINAVQATTDSVLRPRVMIRSEVQANGYAQVTVEDNGPGVGAESQRRIFDPFFTTKDVGEGTGLGLALSQAMVTRIGGNMKYDAAYKRGARFLLNLPLAMEEKAVASQ